LLLNFMPSSTATLFEEVTTAGTAVGFHTEQGQVVVDSVVSAREAVVEDPFRAAVRTAV
jgi:hypothetical protein